MTAIELLVQSVRKATQLEMQADEDVFTPFVVFYNPASDETEVICLAYENPEDLFEEFTEALKKRWEPIAVELCDGEDAERDDFACIEWMYFSDNPSLEYQAMMDSLHEIELDGTLEEAPEDEEPPVVEA